MSVMDLVPHVTGARTVEWTADDDASVERAATEFAAAVGNGYAASVVHSNGDEELIREFDPAAEHIILQAPMAGG